MKLCQNQTNTSKPDILGSFRKMANLKALFYVVYSYKIVKYFGSVIIWKRINICY